jgi:hypothetical protein
VALGLGRAATRFRRIKGHRELATLATALRQGAQASEPAGHEPEQHLEPIGCEREGQGRLRIHLDEGGRYVGIPPSRPCSSVRPSR